MTSSSQTLLSSKRRPLSKHVKVFEGKKYGHGTQWYPKPRLAVLGGPTEIYQTRRYFFSEIVVNIILPLTSRSSYWTLSFLLSLFLRKNINFYVLFISGKCNIYTATDAVADTQFFKKKGKNR
jgi:hypothetical protein